MTLSPRIIIISLPQLVGLTEMDTRLDPTREIGRPQTSLLYLISFQTVTAMIPTSYFKYVLLTSCSSPWAYQSAVRVSI